MRSAWVAALPIITSSSGRSWKPGRTRRHLRRTAGRTNALTPSATLYGIAGAEDEIASDGHVLYRTELKMLAGTQPCSYHASQPANTGYARFGLTAGIKPGSAGLCSHFQWASISQSTATDAIGQDGGFRHWLRDPEVPHARVERRLGPRAEGRGLPGVACCREYCRKAGQGIVPESLESGSLRSACPHQRRGRNELRGQ